ncbi:MAG: type IV pilin protein [Gammaproteobacteria bacterium]|jgi:type IV pilus assembly protein PilE
MIATIERPQQRGFTLIELLITLVIAAILVTVAVPSYQNHVQKARRADAYDCLLNAAQRQESFFYQNNRYASSLAELGLTTASCGEGGHYTLDAPAAGPSGSLTTSYFLAARRASDAQKADTRCGDLTLDSLGRKGNENASWAAKDCW